MKIRYKLTINAMAFGAIAAQMLGAAAFARVHSTLDSDPQPVSHIVGKPSITAPAAR